MTEVVKLKDGSIKFKGKDTSVLRFALKDVWFYYLTTTPRPNKGKTFNPQYPALDSSYSVQVLVSDKKVLKAITKSKAVAEGYSKVTTMTVDAEDFEEQFKCQPPFEADEYTLLKLSRHASFKDGATFDGSHYVPVIQIENGKKIEHAKSALKAKACADHEDKKSYDAIITSPQIGNGSKGHVILCGSWYEFENETNQKPIQESFVLTELVPYVGGAFSTPEVQEDDLDALGLGGLETVQAEPQDAADEIDQQASQPQTQDDLDDPDDFETE